MELQLFHRCKTLTSHIHIAKKTMLMPGGVFQVVLQPLLIHEIIVFIQNVKNVLFGLHNHVQHLKNGVNPSTISIKLASSNIAKCMVRMRKHVKNNFVKHIQMIRLVQLIANQQTKQIQIVQVIVTHKLERQTSVVHLIVKQRVQTIQIVHSNVQRTQLTKLVLARPTQIKKSAMDGVMSILMITVAMVIVSEIPLMLIVGHPLGGAVCVQKTSMFRVL